MKHIFSSGELLFKENKKELKEGVFVAEVLEYENVDENTLYTAYGKLNENEVTVKFKIGSDDYPNISFKSMVNILMQSDILRTNWSEYTIEN